VISPEFVADQTSVFQGYRVSWPMQADQALSADPYVVGQDTR
jgi:hypothetical protein